MTDPPDAARRGRVFTVEEIDALCAKAVRRARLGFWTCVAITVVFGTLGALLLLDGAEVDAEAGADLAVLVAFAFGTVVQGRRLRRLERARAEARADMQRLFRRDGPA